VPAKERPGVLIAGMLVMGLFGALMFVSSFFQKKDQAAMLGTGLGCLLLAALCAALLKAQMKERKAELLSHPTKARIARSALELSAQNSWRNAMVVVCDGYSRTLHSCRKLARRTQFIRHSSFELRHSNDSNFDIRITCVCCAESGRCCCVAGWRGH
jgi:hypothetical protein